eukprot:403356815
MKLIETFECPEDGYSLMWKELLKFPGDQELFFPNSKFMHIWETLTVRQQEEQFMKLGQKQNRPWIRTICQEYMKQNSIRSQNEASLKSGGQKKTINDEQLFSQACLHKTWVQRKQEQKERDLSTSRKKQQNRPTMESQQHTLIRQNHAQSDKLLVPKKKSFEKKEDKRNTNVTDMLKQKLEKRKQNKVKPQLSRDVSKDSSTNVSQNCVGSLERDTGFFSKLTEVNPSLQRISDQSAIFTNTVSQKDSSMSILYNYDLNKKTIVKDQESPSYQKMNNSEYVSQNLVNKMIDFWSQNSQFVEKRGAFKEKELTRIQSELQKFDKYFTYLKDNHPELGDETQKQVFFLNLFNFLVMYYLALNMMSNPEAIEKIQNHNMWQAFLLNCKVVLCNHKINAFEIKHSVLRHEQQQPSISCFLLQTPQIEFFCQKFQIKDPNPLIAFGFFIPVKRLARLKVFSSKDFNNQLKQRAEEFFTKKLRFKDDSNYIYLPKILEIYFKDYGQETYIDLLRYLEDNILESYGMSQLAKFLKEFDKNQKSPESLIFEIREFCWQFHPQRMAKLFQQPQFKVLEEQLETNIILALILIIELYATYAFYVYGYLIAEVMGFGIAYLAFKISGNLLTMGRTKRKWTLWILYWLQFIVFICHFIVSLAMWINFDFISNYIAYNDIKYLQGFESFKNIAIYLGFTTLLQGLDLYMTIYFRKFLGREQIRVEDSKKRLKEMEIYQSAVQHLYQELQSQDVHDIRGTRIGKSRKL